LKHQLGVLSAGVQARRIREQQKFLNSPIKQSQAAAPVTDN